MPMGFGRDNAPQEESKTPGKDRLRFNIGKVPIGAAPGGMPLIAAMLLGLVGFLLAQAYYFKVTTFPGLGDLVFNLFVALSFGFLFIAFAGAMLYSIKNQWAQGALLGGVIAVGMKFGVPLLERFGAPISASPLAVMSVGGNVGGLILPFAFLIDGVDYTWAFLIVVLGTLYYTADDWLRWLHLA